VAGAFVDGVALSALGFEDLLAGGGVSGRSFIERRHLRKFWKRAACCERIQLQNENMLCDAMLCGLYV